MDLWSTQGRSIVLTRLSAPDGELEQQSFFLQAPKGDSRSSWLSQLHTFIHYSIGRMRIADLFDIAASYPDSMHAVHDLQECMKKCDLQRLLIRTFKDSCAARLLIPGKTRSPGAIAASLLCRAHAQQ